MDVSDLRIFQAVAQEGSVSEAARQLNYVQSNVTARINQLEKELNTTLFHRHRRGVTLNEDGRKLLGYTQKIITLMDEIKQSFQSDENPSGPLLIGSVETVSSLPSILSEYHKRYPRIDLSLVSGVTQHLLADVLQYKLDGAFVSGPIEHKDIIQEHLMEEKLVLITRSVDGMESIEGYKNKPLLVFREGCGYRARLIQWLQSEGIQPKKIMEFGTLETIFGVVASGLGVSLVPESTVTKLEKEGILSSYSIPAPFQKVSTVFIRRKDSFITNTMGAFLRTIQEYRSKG
ncbi:LysR family transcriptional regulator [Brevibacillus daliensis]|uniref:LysR family transcriptional regulator n=1 Tax=Brevibacillus daliensis TaxID=2892995 RepID=UPI001E55B4F4|nr:LysR family transcriptional regulator [Brevibacillus daliensis]